MKKITILSLFLILCSSDIYAANFAVITSPPTILSLLIFIVGVGCLVGTMKILSLLRGGLLFKSWQIFMAGFIALIVSQAATLVNDFEVFAVPSFVVPALLAITIGLMMYGVFETKKNLE